MKVVLYQIHLIRHVKMTTLRHSSLIKITCTYFNFFGLYKSNMSPPVP